MKSSEVRIGNIVYATEAGRDGCLVEFTIKNGFDIDNAHWFFGIPLTEEWLLKFGFRRDFTILDMSDANYKIKALDRTLNIQFIYGKIIANIYFQVELKYVHQLQNLYFALTGEGLTISE